MRIKGPNGLTFDMPKEQAEALLRNKGEYELVKGTEKAPAKTAPKSAVKAAPKKAEKAPAKPADDPAATGE